MSNLNGLKPIIPYLLGAAMATIFLCLCLSAGKIGTGSAFGAVNIGSKMANTQQEITKTLKRAAMDDRTVIITVVNEEWASPGSILDLFLESFRVGRNTGQLLRHLVVVAADPVAFGRCKALHGHCLMASDHGGMMGHDHLKMMWWRLEFLKSVLELGYNFISTDTDVMWFRNPFSHFPNGAQITISDYYLKNPSDHRRNLANCGFMYVKSSSQSIEFFKFWIMARLLYPDKNEQQIFNIIRHDKYATRLAIDVGFLDTNSFANFCNPGKDLSKVCTMHANCCIGLERKIHDLRVVLEDWKNYTSRPRSERAKGGFSWRAPDKCKLSGFVA